MTGGNSDISGSTIGTANISSSGAVTFSGTNAITTANVSGGTATFGSGNTVTTLTITSGTAKGGFANSPTLTLNNTGTLDLNGANISFTSPTLASTATITDNSAVSGTSTLAIINAGSISTKVLNGATRNVALRVTNANGGFAMTNAANTFAGGIVLANSTLGTRMVPGTITAGAYGTGSITIGESATDKAGIYFGTAGQTLTNSIVVNTTLGTDVDGGVRVEAANMVFSGTITANLADAQFGAFSAAGSATLTGQVTGSSGLRLANAKITGFGNKTITVTLNNGTANANDYAGATTVDATSGILVLGTNNQIPNGTGKGNAIINGTLRLQGFSDTINGLSGSGTVTTTAAGASVLTLGDGDTTSSFGGTISNTTGTVAITKTGTGTQTFSGNNSYSGGTTLTSGTLIAGHNSALGTGLMTLNGGNLASNDDTRSIANAIAVTGTVGNQVTGDSISFTGTAGGTGTLNMNLSGTTKNMTVNPTAGQFEPGKIQLTKGTLVLGGANKIGDSTAIDLAGGTFKTGGNTEAVGTLTMSADSIIDFGATMTQNTLTFNSGDAGNWTGNLSIYNWTGNMFSGGGTDQLKLTNLGALTDAQLNQIRFFSDAGGTQIGYATIRLSSGPNTGELVPIPEPATIIGALAFLGLIVLRERRRIVSLWKKTSASPL